MTQKRPSSPLPIQNCKKRAVFNDDRQRVHLDEASRDFVNAKLDKLMAKHIDLLEKLAFKDIECQKLKNKFEEVDRNCRKWHSFAIGLQSRVKRLAMIVHRQQDSMKTLKKKSNSTVHTSAQTDNGLPSYGMVLTRPSSEGINGHREKTPLFEKGFCKDEPKNKQESNVGKSTVSNHASAVIDLTDDVPTTIVKNSTVKAPHNKFPSSTGALNNGLYGGDSHLKPSSNVHSVGLKQANSNTRPTPRTASMAHFDAKAGCTNVPKLMNSTNKMNNNASHYPPLPPMPPSPQVLPRHLLLPPFQPLLKIRKSEDGIEVSWDHNSTANHARMDSYELFVHQHNPNAHGPGRWKKIGNDPIKAMPLPMACTLSQFSTASKYYFAVRGKDVHGRYGAFSLPCCSNEIKR